MFGRLAKNAQRRERSDDACDDEQRSGPDSEYGDAMRDGLIVNEKTPSSGAIGSTRPSDSGAQAGEPVNTNAQQLQSSNALPSPSPTTCVG